MPPKTGPFLLSQSRQKLRAPLTTQSRPLVLEQVVQYQSGFGGFEAASIMLGAIRDTHAQRWTDRGARRRPPGRVGHQTLGSTDGRGKSRRGEDDGLQECKVRAKKADLNGWSNPRIHHSRWSIDRYPTRGNDFHLEPKWLRSVMTSFFLF